jgi:transcriptional repressor NrdR
MQCPFCHHPDTRVLDSRYSRELRAVRRRRQCGECEKRFTTYERIEDTSLSVIKKGGAREPFDRRKISAGLKKACEKRPVSVEAIERFVTELETRLEESQELEVPTQRIGEAVMQFLQGVDQVAYVRFASVYRDFKDVDEFFTALRGLMTKQ